jgi:hypothetical protein
MAMNIPRVGQLNLVLDYHYSDKLKDRTPRFLGARDFLPRLPGYFTEGHLRLIKRLSPALARLFY